MENQLTVNLTPDMLALVPVVAMILQLLKRFPAIDQIKEWLPFVSIGVSMALCFGTQTTNPVVASVIIGLVASGGYDALKTPPALPK
jgi:hypothetical protein